MKAPRMKAEDVRVGDAILTCDAPRTWLVVSEVHRFRQVSHCGPCIALDTHRNRTWWTRGDLVPCRRTTRRRHE